VAIGLWYQAKSSFEEGIQEGIRRTLKRRTDESQRSFRVGFVHIFFHVLSQPGWKKELARYSQQPLRTDGFGAPFPTSMDRWLIPRGEDAPLARWLEGPGQTRTSRKLFLLEADWPAMIDGAIRGAVHAEIRWGSRDNRAKAVFDAAAAEAGAAGRAAAFQAVWNFVAGMSDPYGSESWPATGAEQWDAIASMYRSVFDGSFLQNMVAIGSLVDFDEIRLPPFST
jgi:hypothetical protein